MLLVCRIADLFDQYLVYRPDWIIMWEGQQDEKLSGKLTCSNHNFSQIQQHIAWQGILWRALVTEIKGEKSAVFICTALNCINNFYINWRQER